MPVITISMKNVKAFEEFREVFPDAVNTSLDETAAVGKALVMRSTAKGAVGAAQARWDWMRNGEWARLIFNPLKYVRFLETGTGLFGPLKKRIVSKSGGPLHWISLKKVFKRGKNKGQVKYRSRMGSKKGGYKESDTFAMSTRGMPAQPMIEPNKARIQRDLILRMKRTIKAIWDRFHGIGGGAPPESLAGA